MGECVVVVWQIVPYHEARFNAAVAQGLDLVVVEVVGQDPSRPWSERQNRLFRVVRLTADGSGVSLRERRRRLIETLGDLQPGVVAIQGWADWAALTTLGWASRWKVPIVVMSESNSYDRPRWAFVEWFKRRILKFCDAALVGGKDHARYLVGLGFPKERIAYGYNVVDNEHFSRAVTRSVQGVQNVSAPYFLVVARLAPEKNIETIIKAYSSYRKRTRVRWPLVICGTGPEEGALRRLVNELGLREEVIFVGFLTYEELPTVYQRAGALVHLSTSEPWGLVVNEAIAAGLPVIVSRKCGCCCELVRDGVNGFVVDPMDVPRIVEHMCGFAEGQYDRASFAAAGKEIITSFGPERFGIGLRCAFEIARRHRAKRLSLSDKLLVTAAELALRARSGTRAKAC